MAGIPVLVQQGLNAEAIAARLGCKVGTLKVRCSQAQISLRGPKEVKGVPLVPAPKPPKQKRSLCLLPCRPHCKSAKLPCRQIQAEPRLLVQCVKNLNRPTFQLS